MRIGHFEDIALAESERTGDLGGTGQELTQHTSELKPSQAKEVAQVEEVAQASPESLGKAEKDKITFETGWSEEIVDSISSMEEYAIYKNAGLEEGEISGHPALVRLDAGKAEDKVELHHIGRNMDGPLAELTPKEINAKQALDIKNALKRVTELTTLEKGNLCEMMMDLHYISQGYTPVHSPRVTSIDGKGHHGIDGVYEKDGHYIIVDAKYGTAQLGETLDGKQMSAEWIDKRLDDAVGKEKADQIRDAYEDNPDSVQMEVYHYDPSPDANGNTYSDVYPVDENGEVAGSSVTVEAHDSNGERMELPDSSSSASGLWR